MKTRTARNKPDSERSSRDNRAASEDVLAVIVDVDNGREYYMAFIDSFQMNGHEYVVMYNYEPDDGNHTDPEIAIMRSERHVSGEQYYKSIKNKKELEAAFGVFFQRFEASGG